MEHRIPWGPIRSTLQTHFSFSSIKEIVGYMGIDMSQLAGLEQKAQGGATKSQVLSAVDRQVGSMDDKTASKVAAICCEEMLRRKKDLVEEIDRILSRVGWKFFDDILMPIDIFDLEEVKELTSEAHSDLKKASTRLRDGDLSGALSSACGAIDSATNSIYTKYNLGDSGKASFQEKVKCSIDTLNVKTDLEQELYSLGWDQNEISRLSSNLFGSLNHAAYIMQKLRSKMGDVHGTKPVLAALVYDSLKWAALLLRLLTK
jgi:hypothetical protein